MYLRLLRLSAIISSFVNGFGRVCTVKEIGSLGILLQLGWVVALSVLIPLGLGLWLDYRLATSPLFILVGALVGILAATVGVVRITNHAIEAVGKPSKTDANRANSNEDSG
jgi:F0F1-type ATP synthase assembly protein I